MDIVNRIKHYMDTTGITISQFSDRCGIPRPTMSQMLNGRNKRVSDEVISKIHNAYPDLSIMWLLFGEGDMEPKANTQISEAQNNRFEQDSSMQIPTDQHIVADYEEPPAYGVNPSENSDARQNGQFGRIDLEPSLFDQTSSHNNYHSAATSGKISFGADGDQSRGNISFGTPSADASVSGSNMPGGQQPENFHPGMQEAYDASATGALRFTDSNARNPGDTAAINSAPTSVNPGSFPVNPGNSTNTTPVAGNSATPVTSASPATTAGSASSANIGSPASTDGFSREMPDTSRQKPISIHTDSRKKITNIVVFYSDNSFQSFLPES